MTRFTCHGQTVALPPGGQFARPRPVGFRDTPVAALRELVAEVEAGRPWREAVGARYADENPWLHAIVTADSRRAFFGSVLPTGTGSLLDIGAGWGQVARPAAAERPVVALEPVAERLAFIRASAQQEGVLAALTAIEADYLEVEFESRFSAITVIGVLEWVGAFQSEADPQQRQRDFLAKTRRELAPDGCLVLGIENRLGLKYLLGAPGDHLGVPHVECLPADVARQRWQEQRHEPLRTFTYSLPELDRLLRAAGYSRVEFFAALPDYKLPQEIIPLADGGRALDARLASAAPPPEHNGYNGQPLAPEFQDQLARSYRAAAAAGVARQYVPSYFVRAR